MLQNELLVVYVVFGEEELGLEYSFKLSQWSLGLSWNGCHQL